MTPQAELTSLIAPMMKAFKLLGDEWSELLENGLSNYIYYQTDKYFLTNTFLHRGEKVKFDDVYYPIKTTYKKTTTTFNRVEDVFDEYRAITIVGSAGSGKTTLIKYIFLQSIRNRKRIPILIELRNLNDYEGDFEKLLSSKVLSSGLKPNELIFKRTLKEGKYLFLLDGYDEINSSIKNEINRQIQEFVDSYPENKFIITTRQGSGAEAIPGFFDFIVRPLDSDDVFLFIDKLVDNEERRDRIKRIVRDPTNRSYFEFLRNPLLLSMFILAFEKHPEIPGLKSAFYKNVFDTLYSVHDGITKNSFPREKRTKLKRENFESILAAFSYLSLIEEKYSFTLEYLTSILNRVKKNLRIEFDTDDMIYDLRTSISIIILDEFEYSFPHRSMQEYFAASFLSKLSTEKKGVAYKKIIVAYSVRVPDYSFTFWDLCYELDQISFIQHFLIPTANDICALLSGDNAETILKGYRQIASPSVSLRDDDDNDNAFRIVHTATFLDAVIEYSGAQKYSEIDDFPSALKLNSILEKILTNVPEKRAILGLNSPAVDALLIENGFLSLLIDIRSNMLMSIEKWKRTVSEQEEAIDDLLSE